MSKSSAIFVLALKLFYFDYPQDSTARIWRLFLNTHSPIKLELENFAIEVLEKSKEVPVLVDFTAEWCAPCQVMIPILNQLAASSKGKFIIGKVDTDEQQKLAGQYNVRGFPTFKLFRHGKVVEETTGVQSERILREMINHYCI
ncbi:MAG: thioredoxin fold domain-containing protein [Thiotrichaceae bacterium]|nr:thioredoxin fold domain-containing protein [Thiotrichaceae bacterium]